MFGCMTGVINYNELRECVLDKIRTEEFEEIPLLQNVQFVWFIIMVIGIILLL